MCMIICCCNYLCMICAPRKDQWQWSVKKWTIILLSNSQWWKTPNSPWTCWKAPQTAADTLQRTVCFFPCRYFPVWSERGLEVKGLGGAGGVYLVSWSLQRRATTFQNKGDSRVRNISSCWAESRWHRENQQRALTSKSCSFPSCKCQRGHVEDPDVQSSAAGY